MLLLLVVAYLVVLGLLVRAGIRPVAPARPTVWRTSLQVVMTLVAAVAGTLLVVSLGRDWWVVESVVGEVRLTDSGSPGVRVLVALGLASVVALVAGVWRSTTWAPLVLGMAWLVAAGCWFASTGQAMDSDSGGSARSGLRLATSALVLVTAATLASLVDRRRR